MGLRNWIGGLFSRKAEAGPNTVGIPGAFRGTTGSSMWEWIVAPATIDYQIRQNIYRLRVAARDVALNNPIVRQYLELLAQNVIGPNGFKIQPRVRDNSGKLNLRINEIIEEAWCDFWRNPFVDGRYSGIHGERILLKSVARDGEIFVRMVQGREWRHGIALQIIDPDRIDHTYNRTRTPTANEIRMGIEVDEYGKAVGVWIWSNWPQDINNDYSREREFIPASEILHIYDPERANATRGVTWLNSVMQQLRHLDGYAEAAVVAARTAACAFPIFEQSEGMEPDPNVASFAMELNPGTGFTLPAGLKASSWNPNQPNTNYSEFIKGALRFFCSGVHVSYNALSSDLENVNYSSIRSGVLVERDHWRVLQRWWMDAFRQPIYEAWIKSAILAGTVRVDTRDPKKLMEVRWVSRGWDWVDPLKDVQASVLSVQNGLASRSQVVAERGDDLEDILEELKDERESMEEMGIPLETTALKPKPSMSQDEPPEDDEIETEDAQNLLRMRSVR